jgi:hypothetical protein
MRTVSKLFLIPTFVLAACAGNPEDLSTEVAEQEAAEGADGKADSLASTSTYWQSRRDFRKCAYPLCGGYYVEKVNVNDTETYVPEIDTSRLFGLTADEKNGARDAQLFRGTLQNRTINGKSWKVLVVTEAYRAADETVTATGIFRRLSDNGLRCFRAPCFNIHAPRLNSRLYANISDISGPYADKVQVEMAEQGDVIAAGYLHYTSNGGIAMNASQFYRRVVHQATHPCAAMLCGPGTRCEAVPIVCITAPCDPIGQCVPDKCPAQGTTVNCMPGPQPINPLCGATERQWVLDNCPNVDFAF